MNKIFNGKYIYEEAKSVRYEIVVLFNHTLFMTIKILMWRT